MVGTVYCSSYVAEKQKHHSQKLLLFCEQNIEIVKSHIDDIDIDINLEQDAETKAKLMAPRKSIYESPTESVVQSKPVSPPPQSITNGRPSNGIPKSKTIPAHA